MTTSGLLIYSLCQFWVWLVGFTPHFVSCFLLLCASGHLGLDLDVVTFLLLRLRS